jgi:hypothetical protein
MNDHLADNRDYSPPEPKRRIWSQELNDYRVESDDEREHRETLEAEAKERMEREQAEKEAWQVKYDALEAMGSAIRRLRNGYQLNSPYRVDSWRREVTDEEQENFAKEYESALFEVQALGDALREHMPDMFWPKGTPPQPEPLDAQLRKEARALRARLNQAVLVIDRITLAEDLEGSDE